MIKALATLILTLPLLATASSTHSRMYESLKDLEAGYNQYLSEDSSPEICGSEMNQKIVSAVASHIEQALELGHADFIYYPDMGHTHLFVPVNSTVEDPLKDPKLLFLYHTGELILYKSGSILSGELKEDPWIKSRYAKRNIIGTLDPKEKIKMVSSDSTFNTVRKIEGYKEVEVLYFSSSHCKRYTYKKSNEGVGLIFSKTRI